MEALAGGGAPTEPHVLLSAIQQAIERSWAALDRQSELQVQRNRYAVRRLLALFGALHQADDPSEPPVVSPSRTYTKVSIGTLV